MNPIQVFLKLSKVLSKKEKIYSVCILFFMLVAMLFEMLSVGSFLPLTSSLLDKEYIPNFLNKMGIKNDNIDLNYLLILLFFLFLIKNLFLIIFSALQLKFTNQVSLRVMNQIYSYYLNNDYDYHVNQNSSFLIRNIDESGAINSILMRLLNLIMDAIIVIGLVSLLIIVQPIFTITVIIFFSITLFFYNYLTKSKIIKWGQDRFNLNFYMVKNLYEGITAFKEIILYQKSKYFINQNFKIKKKLLSLAFKFRFLEVLPKHIIEVSSILVLILFIFFSIGITSDPKDVIPIFVLYAASAFKIIPSLLKIYAALQNFNYLEPALESAHLQLLDYEKQQNKERANKIKEEKDLKPFNIVEVKNLNFKYSEKNYIIKDLNLKITKNSIIGIKGKSGSGKSTFLNLLTGLIKPTTGGIFVDEQNILENTSSWKKKIGFVSQSVFLLDDTIKNNIAFGVENNIIDQEAVRKSISQAGLDEYVKGLDYREETFVGERGLKISGGQKQRIGIARALYFKPELLVLDEATNSLDKKTENEILQQLSIMKNNMTIIIVSHSDEPLKIADKIYSI
jgi:ABC-type bacteriocin/lantibiotic exporter with double-glycine peptidase domain